MRTETGDKQDMMEVMMLGLEDYSAAGYISQSLIKQVVQTHLVYMLKQVHTF